MNKYKIVLIGPPSAGKSTFLSKVSDNNNLDFKNTHQNKEPYAPTIGVDFGTKMFKYRNNDIKIHIWDTAGQERFDSIVTSYFRDINMSILIYDINEFDCISSIQKWNDKVSALSGNKPIVLIGNKIDKKKNNIEQDYKYIMDSFPNIVNHFEISCFEQDNINYVMDYIYNYIINDPNFILKDDEKNSVNLINEVKQSKCCFI